MKYWSLSGYRFPRQIGCRRGSGNKCFVIHCALHRSKSPLDGPFGFNQCSINVIEICKWPGRGPSSEPGSIHQTWRDVRGCQYVPWSLPPPRYDRRRPNSLGDSTRTDHVGTVLHVFILFYFSLAASITTPQHHAQLISLLQPCPKAVSVCEYLQTTQFLFIETIG